LAAFYVFTPDECGWRLISKKKKKATPSAQGSSAATDRAFIFTFKENKMVVAAMVVALPP
jgi:hypothetical protein